jgi:hypothetical protein
MRMWMIEPKLLCRKHLIGEHFELHKHRYIFVKKYSIYKRIFPIVQIEPSSMKIRHEQLVKEFKRRNYNHNSPYKMPNISHLPIEQQLAKVNIQISMKELSSRCKQCKV